MWMHDRVDLNLLYTTGCDHLSLLIWSVDRVTTLKHSITSKLWALGAEPLMLRDIDVTDVLSLKESHKHILQSGEQFSKIRLFKWDNTTVDCKQASGGIDALISRWAGGSSHRFSFIRPAAEAPSQVLK